MARMVKRRMRQAGLPSRLSPHSFRVAAITDLMSQGVPLEDVQMLASMPILERRGCTIAATGR